MPTTRLVSSLLLAALAIASAARPMVAQPDAGSTPPSAAVEHVIPPGQEPLLADLLGSGQALPGGCKFSDGKIDHSTIVATYDCAGGQVVLDVRHPADAPADAVRSERFAVTIRTGTVPQGLLDAILARIKAREHEFEWKAIGSAGASGLRPLLLLAAAVVCVAALLVWLVRRGRAAGG